jgi:uncharacterized protein with WD repeat
MLWLSAQVLLWIYFPPELSDAVVVGGLDSPDGKLQAVTSADGDTIRLWNVTIGKERATLRGRHPIAFSPDSKLVATAGPENTVKLWDVSTGKEVATLPGHLGSVWYTAFSPDGKALVSTSEDGTVKRWDVALGEEILTFKGHAEPMTAVAFSPDGKTLASGGSDKTIKLWDVVRGEVRATLKGHAFSVHHVTFSPDGKTLASAEWITSHLRLWDVATGAERAEMVPEQAGNPAITYEVESLSFHPNGKTLVSLAGDMIEFWDVTTGSRKGAFPQGYPSRELTLHYFFDDRDWRSLKFDTHEELCSASFRTDGKVVVTGANLQSRTARRWIVSPPTR